MSTSNKLFNKIDTHLLQEIGTVYKDHGGKVRVVLIFPNHYTIGMSNLGFQTVYTILNNRQDTVCERAFLPESEDLTEYTRTGQRIISYETKSELLDFDIVAFSISFENDYPNIIKILNLSNIPVYSSLRKEYHPLLIAGGVCATSNPEPFADIFDVIFIGEVEDTINQFMSRYISIKGKKTLKTEVLDIEGVYVPESYGRCPNQHKTVKKSYFKDFSKKIITPNIKGYEGEFGHLCLFEVMRGCYWRCRFCLVSAIYSPVRLRDKDLLDSVFDTINTKIGLIAPSLSDVPYIHDLTKKDNVRFSITSIRASKNSNILVESLRDKKSLSIAPEAGTERMRKIINKKITEDDILSTAIYAIERGIEILRLYFMIGLPNETHNELEGIVSLIKKIRSLSNKTKLSITLNPFVPKPFTPFQWHRFEDIKTLKYKINFIKKALYETTNLSVHAESPRHAFVQAVFARGGRELSKKIIDLSFTDNINGLLKDNDLKKLVFNSFKYDAKLPWDFIDVGVRRSQLWSVYQEAISL